MALHNTIQMSILREIKVLHLEPTDVCQAACPLCIRETDQNFDKQQGHHLTMDDIVKIINFDQIAKLNKMFMCGDYGDPAAGRHTLSIYKKFRQINPNIVLGMNTNGALRSAAWWTQLAKLLDQPRDYVVFSIDGLEDTNHIYRRNVNWKVLMKNVQAYIAAGGKAHWDMLVYKHNQHQVADCEALAKHLGFTLFRAKVSKRPYINGLEFPVGWQNPIQHTGPIVCQALAESSAYIDAQGRQHPCCWLGNTQVDFVTFEEIQKTWLDKPHPVCKQTCSSKQNSFVNQWQREVALC